MLDNTKFLTYNQTIINRILQHPDFVVCRPKTNNYFSLMHKDFGIKLSLDFRKSFENGILIGYRHLEINTSPHYHYNCYLHNGNDFTPSNSIKTIIDILTYLRIEQKEYGSLKVVNIEFGLNIIPKTDIKNVIDGLYFYKKTAFKTGAFPYFKKTDATSYKQIKAYAKGLQFSQFPKYGINQNTFRFEVKSKQAKNIQKYGITNANDLTKLDIYKTLSQILIDEWENILLTNQNTNYRILESDEVKFIRNANKTDFWNDLKNDSNRNKFNRYKEKYYRLLKEKNNLHHLIKLQLIDKLFFYQSDANSTQKTPTGKENYTFEKTQNKLINLESAPPHQNNEICLVTGLDISMQRKGSKFLCRNGLKYYNENEPEIYKNLEKRFLTEKQKGKNLDRQIYFIAHNIRNTKTNKEHNQKQFEKRNYKSNQLQLNF